jgi:hypothetical protein
MRLQPLRLYCSRGGSVVGPRVAEQVEIKLPAQGALFNYREVDLVEVPIVVYVQLLGNPDNNTLSSLDTFMTNRGYALTVKNPDGSLSPLPRQAYAGVTDNTQDAPLRDTATALSVTIKASLWSRGSIILALYSTDWGLSVDNATGGKSVKEASKQARTNDK